MAQNPGWVKNIIIHIKYATIKTGLDVYTFWTERFQQFGAWKEQVEIDLNQVPTP